MKCLILLSVISLSVASPLINGLLTSQYHVQDGLGQYSFGYAGGPSTKHESKTFDGVTKGGYSYVDANGVVQSASYVADPIHGFRVAATNLPVGHATVPVGLIAPSGHIADTPEVAAAKLAHFAAHAEARSRLRRSVYWPAPLKPDGTVDETPEVKAATAAHLAAHSLAKSQSVPLVYSAPLLYTTPYIHHRFFEPAPLNYDGTVAETPEVKAATAIHLAAHHEALLRHKRSVLIPAPLNHDGTVAETPEVKAAKAIHFAAHSEARARAAHLPYVYAPHYSAPAPHYYAPAPLKPDGTVDDTPEVKTAKAIHYAAHANAKAIGYPLVYSAPLYTAPVLHHYYPSAPLNLDGTVAETPEVAIAKAAHLAAHHEALTRHRRFAPLKPDGTVDDTPEVKAAKAIHYAAISQARTIVPGPVYTPTVYNHHYFTPAPLNADGTVADTAEITAAKAVHFAAHADANLRIAGPSPVYSHSPVWYPAPHTARKFEPAPLNPDGTVADTPEVAALKAARIAALHQG